MQQSVTLDEVVELTSALSVTDQMRLIERMLPDIRRQLNAGEGASRRSLRGIWRGLNITAEDIDVARHEMWSDFPSRDL